MAEITPPSSIAKTPEATEQLFSVLHGARAARTVKERMISRSPVMSFEIVSTRKDGIRYLLQMKDTDHQVYKEAIVVYTRLKSKLSVIQAVRIVLSSSKKLKHYVLPLTLTSVFEQHDPLGYVTGAMTQLGDDEEITLQLVAMPVHERGGHPVTQNTRQ